MLKLENQAFQAQSQAFQAQSQAFPDFIRNPKSPKKLDFNTFKSLYFELEPIPTMAFNFSNVFNWTWTYYAKSDILASYLPLYQDATHPLPDSPFWNGPISFNIEQLNMSVRNVSKLEVQAFRVQLELKIKLFRGPKGPFEAGKA